MTSTFILTIGFIVLVLFEWRHHRLNERRFLNNLALAVINNLLFFLLPLGSLVAVATWAESSNWGLFNQLAAPVWLEMVPAVVAMDCIIYWQHRASHAFPWFWQLHKVHHSDQSLDTSTGLRFHPVELALSLLLKALTVLILGLSPSSIIVFECLLTLCSLFIHAHLELPQNIERKLWQIIVTPRLHRIHHHWLRPETDRNFCTIFSCWDRLFNTFRLPQADDKLVLGLLEYRGERCVVSVVHMLLLPFNRRSR